MSKSYTALSLVPSNEEEEFGSKDVEEDDRTIDMGSSDGGYSEENEGKPAAATTGNQKNKKQSPRILLGLLRLRVLLLLVLLFMVLLLVILSAIPRRRIQNQPKQDNIPVFPQEKIRNQHHVLCDTSSYHLTMEEWRNQRDDSSSSLCDPTFQPHQQEADMDKPVQVFVLLGEGNMVGDGHVRGDIEGTLDYTVFKKERFTHLIDRFFDWTTRSDVRSVHVGGDDFVVYKNEWLGMAPERHHVGPELQFGYIMAELLDSPVLILKSCSSEMSLGGDLLPPGSRKFEHDGYVYAGYGESPERWKIGSKPSPSKKWYAGKEYDVVVKNAMRVLSDIGTYYPGATEYEVAGFVWWQGETDASVPPLVPHYEDNLVRLIQNLRESFHADDAKFAIATVGADGQDMHGNSLRVLEAQLALNKHNKYPEFASNVRTVDIRSSWRPPFTREFKDDKDRSREYNQYGHNAETVMEVGNALGLAMANLLNIP